jgi:hypothetical protein
LINDYIYKLQPPVFAFHRYLDVGCGFVAAYHLVVLSVLRGILLTARGRNPPTPLQTLGVVVGLWLLATLGAIPFIFTIQEYHSLCMPRPETVERDIWLLNLFSCFIPVFLIAVIYVLTHLMGKRYFEDSYSYKVGARCSVYHDQ